MKFLRKLYSIITGALTVKGNINIQADSNASIGTVDNYSLSLRTNNTDRVVITSSGKVGIGTSAPSYTLDISGSLRTSSSATLNGLTVSNGFLTNAYIAQNTWAIGVLGSYNGIGLSINRLLGATCGRYTITTTNVSNVSGAFDGLYEYPYASISAGVTGTLEIDFNPQLNWTANQVGGFSYGQGILVISFYYTNYATNIQVDWYRYDTSSGSDIWETIYSTTSNSSNPVLIYTPSKTYIKKLRITLSNPNTTVYITEIEWFPYRENAPSGQSSNMSFSNIPKYSIDNVDVGIPQLSFRDTTWATKALIKNTGDASFLGNIGIGTTAPSAKLHVSGDTIISGAFSTKVTTITANTTLDNTYHIVLANATNGAITITLPSASTCSGRQYVIKKIDSSTNAVTIAPQSGQTIDGQTGINITTQNDLRRIVSNGTNWYII